MEKILLIDGHSILNRAFYGVPDLTNSEGIHTNALYGFLNIMFKFIDEEKPDYLVVAFDLSEPTFRHKKYAEYKGTRKPMPEELRQQVPIIKEILAAMNITIAQMPGYEADDILGTIAKTSSREGKQAVIISGDRDLLQLCEDNICVRIPKTKGGVTEVENYLPEDVYKLYGVTPTEFIDVKALMGDTSDNIPGAPGIGPKTATAIIQKYHSIENVLEHLDEITPPKAKKSIFENMKQVCLSRFLAEININVPIDIDINNARLADFYNKQSYELFVRYNFKSFLKNFDESITKTTPKSIDEVIIIENREEFDSVIDECEKDIAAGKICGIHLMWDDAVYGIGLAVGDRIIYAPALGLISQDCIIEAVCRLSEVCVSANKRSLAGINLKNSMNAFSVKKEDGYYLNDSIADVAFTDVALGAYLINPNIEKYDAASLALEYLKETVPDEYSLLGKNNYAVNMMTNMDNMAKHAGICAYVAKNTCELITERLKDIDCYELFTDLEMPLSFVLHDMELAGIRVDREALKSYSNMLVERIGELEQDIYKDAGEQFNINSPKQLGVILFEKLGMPGSKKTKSGYSTAADVLEKLSGDYPLVKKILEYRTLTKLNSTYAEGLVPYIREDSRIHGRFNQTITATGRISSAEPNLQNIPIRMELGRRIRKVFIPKDDYVFIDADYSQIELRILAHMSNDSKLIEAYKSAKDIHRITASQVFKVDFDEVTDEQRRNAKAVNFGIIYGISSFGLSQDLNLSKKEADSYIKQYFEAYPDIKDYIDGLVAYAKENGYSITLFNRRRPIPELKSSNFMQRAFGERVAMNAPIQGTAADIIKFAMVNVYNELRKRRLRSRLILQVHDELLVEAHKDEVEEVKEIIEYQMKNAAALRVPLEIGMEAGSNWYEAH